MNIVVDSFENFMCPRFVQYKIKEEKTKKNE